jgi:hypothetical protein
LLAKVVAKEPAPVLEVLSLEPVGDRTQQSHFESRFLVKLGCRLPGACLPFYSIVSRPEAPVDGISGEVRVIGNTALKSNAAIVIHAGAHAKLVMDDARSHVEVSVVSLENGMAGHRIHVASPDHKQIYTAEVVNANLLRRSF